MHAGASSRYLDACVATASQPELQLMLLDGALRFAAQARGVWDDASQRGECDRLLSRTLDIVEELVRGATLGVTELSQRLQEEYAFAFRQLTLAQLNHAAQPLEAAVKLLEFQRETWKLACQKLRAEATTIPPLAAPAGLIDGSLSSGAGLSLQG